MSELPEPLTPVDCDLRGMSFMPLDVQQVRDSTLTAKASGDAFRAAVLLWCAAWQQVPAASLPDDDEELAHLCGYGRAMKEWRKIRQWALHKFVKCSDGRLYHPLIAEKALEALPRRRAHQEAATGEKSRKERERDERKRMFAELSAAGINLPWNTKTGELRDAHAKLDQSRSPVTEPVTLTCHAETVTGHEPVTPPVTAKTGTGTGTYPLTPKTVTPEQDHQTMCGRLAEEAGMLGIPSDHRLLREWLALPRMELERDILPVVRRVTREVREKGGPTPFKFRLFDAAIREQWAADERELERLRNIQREHSAPTVGTV